MVPKAVCLGRADYGLDWVYVKWCHHRPTWFPNSSIYWTLILSDPLISYKLVSVYQINHLIMLSDHLTIALGGDTPEWSWPCYVGNFSDMSLSVYTWQVSTDQWEARMGPRSANHRPGNSVTAAARGRESGNSQAGTASRPTLEIYFR